MLCLLLETSSPVGSLALYLFKKNTLQLLVLEEWTGPTHSAFITKGLEKILHKTKIHLSQLSAIVLGIGPGRFTGVRLGVSFAKTLAFAYPKITIYPLSSLKILAGSVLTDNTISYGTYILTFINAFKNSVYKAYYKKQKTGLKEIVSPCVEPLSENLKKDVKNYLKNPYVCLGDGWSDYSTFWSQIIKKNNYSKKPLFPHVTDLATIFQKDFHELQTVPWSHLQAVYLRSPVEVLNHKKNNKRTIIHE